MFGLPVIPGRAKREPGIHRPARRVGSWIPGSCCARPGMTLGRPVPCEKARRAESKLSRKINAICLVQPSQAKYPPFVLHQISSFLPRPTRQEGRSRSSRTRGGMRWTWWPRLTSVACRGRRSRVVLAPRCWRQVPRGSPWSDGGKKAVHREEREVSRKPIAQGRPDASAELVCSCAFSSVRLAHETAGAARTRSSLHPLSF